MGIAEKYLYRKYNPDELIDISNKNWTYDINMIKDGTTTAVEVKDRNINSDSIYEADDILIEIMQDYRYYNKFGNMPFGLLNSINYKKYNNSLGWIYTEVMDKLIYIKHVKTESYIGKVIYDIDFIKFKSYFITHILTNEYPILKNSSQKYSSTESINLAIPIKDFPIDCYKKYEFIKIHDTLD